MEPSREIVTAIVTPTLWTTPIFMYVAIDTVRAAPDMAAQTYNEWEL
jgi:hypothetical protein